MKRPTLRGFVKNSLLVLAVVLVGLVLVMSVSYAVYFSPPHAALPCRNCTGETQAVQVNGFDLYYRSVGQRGNNPPIVLLHGAPGMSSQAFKQGFAFLADSNQVVYYDQRGSGNSQIRPDVSAYTMEQLVDELETLRRDILANDRMILIGHSAGGALAQHYALKYPEQVDKMILIGALPANGGQTYSGVAMDAIVALMNVVSGNIPQADPQQADAWYADLGYRASLSRLYDPGHAELLQDFSYSSFAVNRELTRSTLGGNYDEQLKQLPMETLIIYGVDDSGTYTGEAVARQMAATIPHSTLVGFERSEHWPYLEEPQRFQEVIREFVSK